MASFATYEDLEKRLGRVFEPSEREWISTLLEDAAEYLRGVIGQRVWPPAAVTFTDVPTAGLVRLPQLPVASIESVTDATGKPVPYKQLPAAIRVKGTRPVTVSYRYGVMDPPRELIRLSCVLVSQTLVSLSHQLGLTSAGVSSIAIDDFRIAFANGGEQTGFTLTPHTIAAIQKQFGTTANITVGDTA
ncbi:hypothetical protein [Canibacter oris]|uniref:Uncharacterized protein n=1 Tax=Canibacter oris TaxID=1365628 RepID=A0A840DH44_9MICO|nr:hypothetical protein [Canibacter oris]MBB4072050.1 hypothetical protein [Canibacter oris]